MARIAGITLPKNKNIQVALTYIYGIGIPRAHKILDESKIDRKKTTDQLSEEEENLLRQLISKFTIEGDLRREIGQNIKILKDINCYRGTRHRKNLPARGQRTKTNSRTVRGNVRRTMGSGRSKSAQKT
ncbi:MAG TPA: 30S ribosomal protein S13 [Candidatus Jacksonbacteria bacterium]|nr:MAG: SSU ribosomal protein S13p (S18e) [Parcubacteria group bacterium GW2011_GWA2_42_28]KKT55449.1 MAG: SSU ribosomal protein S13p (S18e) [Parcubacteria group bacterium GW2011_GWC2_44_22]HBH45943.1 30S ribosomal protein S13 [Candidatus Jacksonbacteria bacterium]